MLTGSEANSETGPAGAVIGTLTIAAAIAFIVSAVALAVYRRAVARLMRTRSRPDNATAAPPLSDPSHRSAPVSDYLSRSNSGAAPPEALETARARQRRLALVYFGAGVSCCFVLTLAELFDTGMGSRLAFLRTFACNTWPVILTLHFLLGWNWYVRRRNEVIYACVLITLGWISHLYHPKFSFTRTGEVCLFINAPPTVLALAFANRRLRGIGPTVFPLSVGLVAGVWTLIDICSSNREVVTWLSEIAGYVGVNTIRVGVVVIGLLATLPLGWLAVHWITRRYRARLISDQSLLIDSVWLLFVVTHVVIAATPVAGMSGQGVYWAAGAFPAYLVAKAAGLRWLRRHAPVSTTGVSLLVLRAFALGKRAERVFDPVTLFWRYVGDVRLIGGPDLATSIVQPHSFLDFASGRLRRSFIDSPETLESRMAELEVLPDPDGRFRINDFFCYDDMWRAGVTRLVGQSHVILADFRGVTIESRGCEYEIREVLNTMPVERIVILVDRTTDMNHLAGILEDSWSSLQPASPNIGCLHRAIPTVFYEAPERRAVSTALDAVFAAAGAPSGSKSLRAAR